MSGGGGGGGGGGALIYTPQKNPKNSSSLRCHVKFQTQQIHVATKIVTLWNSRTVTVKQSTINSPH